MAYRIRLGVPEMAALWDRLKSGNADGTARREEQMLYRKLGKAMKLLSETPRQPGLRSHIII